MVYLQHPTSRKYYSLVLQDGQTLGERLAMQRISTKEPILLRACYALPEDTEDLPEPPPVIVNLCASKPKTLPADVTAKVTRLISVGEEPTLATYPIADRVLGIKLTD